MIITLKEPNEDEAAAFRAWMATTAVARRFEIASHLADLYTIMNECRQLDPDFAFPARFVAEIGETADRWDCVRS